MDDGNIENGPRPIKVDMLNKAEVQRSLIANTGTETETEVSTKTTKCPVYFQHSSCPEYNFNPPFLILVPRISRTCCLPLPLDPQ